MVLFSNIELLGALLIGVGLDLVVGDPRWLWHPVRAIGSLTTIGEPLFRALVPGCLRCAGAVLTVIIVGVSGGITYALLYLASAAAGSTVAIFVAAVIIFWFIAIRSLTDMGNTVAYHLEHDDVDQARAVAGTAVSRSLAGRGERDIVRATIETTAENISDAIVAPLFYLAIGGPALMVAYKALNTLDSMIGYAHEPYTEFGWFAARADDVANYIPARITGALIVVIATCWGNGKQAMQAWVRDAQKGPSPNGGIPIVTIAGALDITLGGQTVNAGGEVVEIPAVGGSRSVLTASDIYATNSYLYAITVICVGVITLAWLSI